MASTICLHPVLALPLSPHLRLTTPTSPTNPTSATPTQCSHPPSPIKPSLLLTLPYELRLAIYTHALSLTEPATPRAYPTTFHLSNPTLTHVLPGLPLLLTCRQIYNEGRLLPFQTNEFTFIKWYGSSVYNAKRWMGKLAAWQARSVRVVDVWVAGREVVEVWRREEGWCALVGLLEGDKGGVGEQQEEGMGKGVVIKAHIREDDVWGVERVRLALEGCLRHDLDTDVAGEGGQKRVGRVKMETVVEDMGLGKDKPKKSELIEELVVMQGWAYGVQGDVW